MRFPGGIDISFGLRPFQGRDGLFGCMLAVELWFPQWEAFQLRPGDHPEVFGSALSQIEDVADEFGHRVRTQLDGPEELGSVGRDHVAKEGLLVAEMRVQAFLAGAGGPGDAIDARSGQAVLRELRAGRGKDLVAELSGRSHSISIRRRTGSFVMVVPTSWKRREREL